MSASILHNNGQQRLWVQRGRPVPNLGPVWCRLLEGATPTGPHAQPPRPPTGVDLVLCSTRTEPQYTERILDSWNIGHTVLGRHLDRWTHVAKLQLVLDHIERHPEPEILMHLDATDVLIVSGLEEVADSFRDRFQCDLLFGAEKCSAPGAATARGIRPEERRFLRRIEEFESATYPPPFRHLNAGCFVGTKPAIAELFAWILEERRSWPIHSVLPNGNVLADDDQLILRELHRRRHPRVQIDAGCRIFQNLFAVQRHELAVDLEVPGTLAFLAALGAHLGELATQRVRRFDTRLRTGRRR